MANREGGKGGSGGDKQGGSGGGQKGGPGGGQEGSQGGSGGGQGGQKGGPGQGGSGDEGTAMMEIIQDLVPNAQLYFATANGGTSYDLQRSDATKMQGRMILPGGDGRLSLKKR